MNHNMTVTLIPLDRILANLKINPVFYNYSMTDKQYMNELNKEV
jgi:hypothetical protein